MSSRKGASPLLNPQENYVLWPSRGSAPQQKQGGSAAVGLHRRSSEREKSWKVS
jgi:hypothetical protein